MKKKPVRSTLTRRAHTYMVRVPPALKEQIDAIASRDFSSGAGVIRKLIAQALREQSDRQSA